MKFEYLFIVDLQQSPVVHPDYTVNCRTLALEHAQHRFTLLLKELPGACIREAPQLPVVWQIPWLVLAISVDRYLNGLTRPFWGWVSDHIGRENTMFIAFTLEAIAVFSLLQLISRPVWFIALSGLCFFAWGEIFSLFPSITGDLFGKTWATTNYGIVYTAKGAGAFFAGVGAAWLFEKTGSWTKVFWAMIVCDLIAAFLALFWLKRVAARTIEDSESGLIAPALVSARGDARVA